MAKKNTDYLEAAKKAREEAAQRYESGQEIRTEAKIKNTWGNTGSKNAGASTSSKVKIENRTKTDVAKLTQQKKKEDASAFKVLSETEKKSNTTKKALEDYLASDEKKALKKKQMDDQMAKAMLFGVTDAQMEQEVDRKEEQLKKEADYWEAQVKKEREAKTMERDTKAVESWDDADKEELERYIQNRQSAFVQSLNPAATGLPAQYEDSYLIQKYGRQRLDEIASSYQRQKNAEKIAAQEQRGRDAVNANGFSAAGANVASVGANLADTLLNPLERIANMAGGKDARYSTLDPNAGGQAAAYASGVRQQSAENIAGSEEGVQLSDGLNKREALALAYQGGMGFLDTAARSAVGMSPTVGAGLAAMGSFNQTLADASAKGATPAEAVAMATASAGIEALTEKIPLDELFKVANSGSKSFGKVLLNVMKQMGIEVLEEEASLIATTLAEAAILRGKSSYNQQIMGAVLAGIPFEQAKAMADNAILEEAKQTAIVSAVSGFMGATGAEYNAYRYVGNVDNQQEQNAAPQATEAVQEQQEEVLTPDAELTDIGNLLEGLRQEQADQQEAADSEWMRQMFEDAIANKNAEEAEAQRKKTAQESDIARQNEKDRQKVAYESLQEEIRKQKDLEKTIAKAEQKLEETGKGSQARIDQLKTDLERQKDIVSQKQKFLNYREGNYDTNLESAIKTQQDLYENARMQVTLAIADYNDGRISAAQLQDAKNTYNNAGQELYRLKNMTPEQYRMELASIGLVGDLTTKQKPTESNWMEQSFRQEQPVQTEQITAQQEQQEAERAATPQAKTVNTKAQSVPQNSTQRMDTFEQSTEGGQIKGTGAAEANFSGKAAYQDLLQEGNVQPDRPGDVRPMEVPKTDGNGKRVTEFAANAYGAEVTTDDMANTIESLIQDGELGFDVRTNRESLDNAAAAIKKRGAASTRKQLTNRIDHKKIQDGDIEQGILLYAKYAEKGDIDNASEMLVDLAQMANITGRNLQMFKLLRRMTVEGQVMTLEKEVRRTVESLVRSGQVKKDYEPTFDPDLMSDYRKALEELRAAKTPEAQEAAKQKAKETQDAIYAVEAAKMPATIKAKWDAWRYMAMLGNVKTQVRNIAGNIMFKPYKEVKDTAAALFEKALPKDRRTKALVQDPALLKWAKSDAGSEDVQNALKYTAKLGDDVTSQKISEQRQIFDNKVLDNVRKFVEKVPQAGDMLFKNDYYARSLAGFLKARGYTAAQIQNGQIDNAVLTEARTYAIDEAMKATFNDSNAFSDAISSIGRGGQDNPWKKALNVAAEGILPFRRTPANIVVRFAEYSPAGIAKGMWDMATHVRNGDMSAAAAIDQIAAGLTGTGMMALGYMMAAGMNGVKLTGSGTEEDEKRQGHQDYALEFAYDGQEYSYRIDWAAPANLPLFVGANIYNAMQNAGADPDVSKFTSIIRGMGTAFEPMLALSCLSSFNDLVEGIRYAQEGEAVYNMAANVATSYFTQGIPALLRQGYQATQETKQTTFANDADPTIRDLQKTAANIPFVGDKFQTEKVNAWGETEDQGDWMTRTFNAFVNPGSVKEIDNGPLEQEMNRLNDAQTENVTPPTATKTLSYTDKQGNAHNNVRLTEEQYQTFAQTQGKTAKDILDSMIKSADYAAMNDEQKAKAIQQAYSYARKKAEIAAIGDDHTGYDESWMMEMDAGAGADYIIRRVTKSEISGAMDALDTAWDKGYDTTGRSDDLKWAYDTFSKMSDGAKADAREWLTGTAAKYVEAREKGISHDDFLSAAKNVELVKGTGANGTVRDIDRREAIAKTTGLSAKEIDTVMKAYMEDYDPDAESPKTTELKYDYIRHVMGLTPAQYAETYRARLDNSKKKDQIAAMVALGYDKKVATKLYNIYAGNKKGKAAYMGYYNSK